MTGSRPLLVLSGDERLLRNLGDAAGPRFRVRACADWWELRDAARGSPPGSPAVVDPYHDSPDASLSPQVGRMAAEFPSVPLVPAMEVTPHRMRDVRTLRDWNAAEVIALPVEGTPRCMERLLQGARARPFVGRMGALLPPSLAPRATAMLLMAAQAAVDGGGEVELAAALRLRPEELESWCRRAGLPPAARVMRRMRALVARHLVDDPGRTPDDVARALGRAPGSLARLAAGRAAGGAVAEGVERLVREVRARAERRNRERGPGRA